MLNYRALALSLGLLSSSWVQAASLNGNHENSLNSELHLECGESSVSVGLQYVVEDNFKSLASATIKATQKSKKIQLVFEDAFFDIACILGSTGKKFIAFQSYCGGSGCRDLDNFGIIDASNLRVLLVPSENNRQQASKILGLKVISISDYNVDHPSQ